LIESPRRAVWRFSLREQSVEWGEGGVPGPPSKARIVGTVTRSERDDKELAKLVPTENRLKGGIRHLAGEVHPMLRSNKAPEIGISRRGSVERQELLLRSGRRGGRSDPFSAELLD
jgi:hypothetical protein